MDYQEVFNQRYLEKQEEVEEANDYSLMLWGLEAVLNELGYNITADWMSTRWHSIVVNAHRFTDLQEIAECIVGWTRNYSGSRYNPSFTTNKILDGDLGYHYLLNKRVTLDPATINRWENDIQRKIKEIRTRYGSARYEKEIVEPYAEAVYNQIFAVLEANLEDWKANISKQAETWQRENSDALNNAQDFRKLAKLLEALEEVAEVTTTETKEWLNEHANKLESGANRRQLRIKSILSVEVVDDTVIGAVGHSRLRDFVVYHLGIEND